MKVFIFDLDDTIIYYPFGEVNYDKISFDSNINFIVEIDESEIRVSCVIENNLLLLGFVSATSPSKTAAII